MEKAKTACRKLGKPSEANASVLKGLFPAYSQSGNKRMKFDPDADSVVADQQRRKKAAAKAKGRSKVITVVLLETMPSS